MISTTEEEQLFNKLKAGDENAFDQLFNSYYKYLVYIAFQYLKDDERSKDVVQEVFMDLWKRRSEIQINQSLKAFLRRAVINKSLNIIRKNERISYLEAFDGQQPDQNQVDDLFEYKELEEVISNCVAMLPTRCQEIFKLSRYENLSHKEIAAQLDISTKTIENQMTKALKRIAEGLKKHGLLDFVALVIHLLGDKWI